VWNIFEYFCPNSQESVRLIINTHSSYIKACTNIDVPGATNVGLPHLEVRDCGVWTLLAKPKSATLISESPSFNYLFVCEYEKREEEKREKQILIGLKQ
jgi:hypothetical protein